MRSAIAVAALAGVAAAFPQVGGAPTAKAPAGCAASAPAPFQITVVNVTTTAKRSVEKRDILTLKLNNGVLTDAQNRVGSIVANYQFQFDPAPGQAGAIYTSGWSLCGNGSLALGGSAIFYQCLSGDFYNLYDRSWAPQCSPIYLVSLGSTSNGGASQLPDGQVNGGTGTPVTQIGDGQIQKPTGKPISQIGDGQIQAPKNTGKPVSQISDGQIQAPKVTTTARPVSQIGDGQVQAPKVTTTARPVSQIGDGQIQAPVTNATRTTSAIPLFTGAANAFAAPIAAIAGVAAALAML